MVCMAAMEMDEVYKPQRGFTDVAIIENGKVKKNAKSKEVKIIADQ